MKTKRSERYVKIDASVYGTPAFRTLPSGATKLYLDLRMQYNGFNNGRIVCTLSRLRERGWVSDGTLTKALWTLLDRGLLLRTRQGKPGPFRMCAYYAFADLPIAKDEEHGVRGANPSHEYASWVNGQSFAPESRARKISATCADREKSLPSNPQLNSSEGRNVTAANDGELTDLVAAKTVAAKQRSIQRKSAPVVDFRTISD